MNKKKILIVLPSLKAGGAERVMSFLAKNIDAHKYGVTILVLGYEKDAVYDVSDCNIVFLEKRRLLQSLVPIVQQIYVLNPDVVLSSITHVNLYMSVLTFFFRKVKFIAREASVVSKRTKYSTSNFLTHPKLITCLYTNFSKIICQSQEMLDDLEKNYKIPRNKLIIINNPITNHVSIKERKHKQKKFVQFVTIGRLSVVKGHARILEALAQSVNKQFHYTIIGDGPLKKELQELTSSLKLEKKVTFISYTKNVSEFLSNMDVFLQGSYVEGFPNAVLESCVVGTPVLAFKAPGGTKEIIKNNVNGFIVENKDEFINKLNNITDLNALQPNKISDYVNKKFNSRVIVKKYETLFNSL